MTFGGTSRLIKAGTALTVAMLCGAVQAHAPTVPGPWQLNLTPGESTWSHVPYSLNNIALGICVVLGVLVFGAMFISIIRFRKSRGAVAEKWSHNTTVEVIWITIPVIILTVLAYLASGGLVSWANTENSQLTVKVTGYQWKWRYDYVSYLDKPVANVGFISKLDQLSDDTRQLGSGLSPWAVKTDGENTYLLNVDKPLVIPVDTKVRFLITSGDVIHSWWVPATGWKLDAVPGIINAAWTNITKPGTYRGQCAELCGQDHGFMPIVVVVKSKPDFAKWLAEQEAAGAKPATAASTATAGAAEAPAVPGVAAAVVAGNPPQH
jgi:cytochrome c oxidase subunit 2